MVKTKYGEFTLTLFEEIRRRLTSAFQVLKSFLSGHKEVVSSVEIKGDSSFCEAVKEALLLLKETDPSTSRLTDQYLTLIIQGRETLLDCHRYGVVLGFDEREPKDTSKTWLACLLAYEAYRSKMYQEYSSEHKQSFKVPEAAYSGDKAWDFMYECLQKVGGTYEEMQHLKDFIEKEREKTETK